MINGRNYKKYIVINILIVVALFLIMYFNLSPNCDNNENVSFLSSDTFWGLVFITSIILLTLTVMIIGIYYGKIIAITISVIFILGFLITGRLLIWPKINTSHCPSTVDSIY